MTHSVNIDDHHWDALADEAKERGFRTVSGMLWYILCERYQNPEQETLRNG
jgi:hypothetical protein